MIVAVGDSGRPVTTVGVQGHPGVDHDVVALQIDGSARAAGSASACLVAAGAALAAHNAYVASYNESATGYDFYGAAARAT